MYVAKYLHRGAFYPKTTSLKFTRSRAHMSFSFTRSVSFASFFSSQCTHVSSLTRSSLERRRSHRSSSSSNHKRIFIANASHPTEEKEKKTRKKIVVVGAGWGGWGAAKALLESNECEGILLDGLKDPTGKTGQKTASGKPFESYVLVLSYLLFPLSTITIFPSRRHHRCLLLCLRLRLRRRQRSRRFARRRNNSRN